MPEPRILIAAGGTGGHVYPAIAIADALKARQNNTKILFVGTKDHMEWQAVPKAGYKITDIWISGFQRQLTLKNLLFPLKLMYSLLQSVGILHRFKPQVVVSCGGYAAGPIGWVAGMINIPLVIQEQNSFPGVTNRLLGKFASVIFTAFKEADTYFPEGKTKLAGNPTRTSLTLSSREESLDMFGFSGDLKTILILGGSGGAQSINTAMQNNLDTLHHELGLQIIWQCGKKYYDKLSEAIDESSYPNLRLTDFLYNMAAAYATADLVISRAGAGSCSELMLTGKPSILIPSPNVAGNHQMKNAQSMSKTGAAYLLKDEDAASKLASSVSELIGNENKLKNMGEKARKLAKPDAALRIAHEILTLSKAQLN